MLCLFIAIFIAGCTEAGSQSIKAGDLILDKDEIQVIEISRGASQVQGAELSHDEIAVLLSKITDIPVKKLTKDQDEDFMTARISDESVLNISFYGSSNSWDLLKGEILIWPDGCVYLVDVKSMQSDERTISYLSESKYPEIYEWVNTR